MRPQQSPSRPPSSARSARPRWQHPSVAVTPIGGVRGCGARTADKPRLLSMHSYRATGAVVEILERHLHGLGPPPPRSRMGSWQRRSTAGGGQPELQRPPATAAVHRLAAIAARRRVTLLTATRDGEHSGAEVLRRPPLRAPAGRGVRRSCCRSVTPPAGQSEAAGMDFGRVLGDRRRRFVVRHRRARDVSPRRLGGVGHECRRAAKQRRRHAATPAPRAGPRRAGRRVLASCAAASGARARSRLR